MNDNRANRKVQDLRLRRLRGRAGRPLTWTGEGDQAGARPDAMVDCGWGRLFFAQTFADPRDLATAMRAEGANRRDIAFYVYDPHVLLAAAPQDLFLDPSHSFRLELATYRASRRQPRGFVVRRLTCEADAEAANRIYAARGMVQVEPTFFWSHRDSRAVTCFIAEEDETGAVVGTVMGINHVQAFNDPENGSSLWSLAVDPQARQPGIGEALVRRIAEHFKARGLGFLDLSVMHDNDDAIALYEKLGFRRISAYGVKRRNPINEPLFTDVGEEISALNPYARIIVNEAMRRGIEVKVTDAAAGVVRLTQGGRSVQCRESLSDLTSAVAMSICDDKALTRRIVERAGVRVPEQIDAGADREEIEDFLARHGALVVKPARGEQGQGVAVGLAAIEEVEAAIEVARRFCDRVLIEEAVDGSDLRLVVIDYRVVAAAIRLPARIVGDGIASVGDLIERQSRRRAAATGGESRIPRDGETERCLARAGYGYGDILPRCEEVDVRKTANLHTGGTIHDVTGQVHGRLLDAAVKAARAIEIPVVGIDLMVRSPHEPDYAFIEANERPGLANHEPQPTAERFVDLLFPLSVATSDRFARAAL